ncbi:MAG: DEAD/DEAH box helicase [Firmicutes bacterium]|nr:DEAD/DEAH box helicase [Bacillota bacterium]
MADKYGITAALHHWLDDAAIRYLDEVDIEKLKIASPNLRLSGLQNAGITTVGKAYNYSPRSMERLPGVGADTVRQVKAAARAYIAEAKKEVPIRLDPEGRPPLDTRLIQALYAERKDSRGSAEEAWNDFLIHGAEYYTLIEQYDPYRNERQTQVDLPAEIVKAVLETPADLRYFTGTPRSYQLFGIQYSIYEKRSLLGDEMGLGKTIQALGLIAHLYAQGRNKFLVICPASVLINWQREAEKFCQIPAYIFHGQDMEQDIAPWMEKGGIGVTNFESLGKLSALWHMEEVSPEEEQPDKLFDLCVIDEAHYIKNPAATRTILAGRILKRAEYALMMTGTPLENKVDEMCQLVELIRPEFADELRKMAAYDKATQFSEKAAPVYLRRTRDDVLTELPDLIEEDAWVELTKEERNEYRKSVMAGNFMAMRQVSWEQKDPKESVKALRLREIVEEAGANKRKVIVFSFFRNTLEKVREILGEAAMEPINGSVPPAKRQAILDAFAAGTFPEEDPKNSPDGEDQSIPYVLPCQVISGGMGLNIQSASVVIFCEPQIKPSLETQAISRAYRMGQVQKVLVFRLYAKDTVDEKIREILMEKQSVFDEYADPSSVGEESLSGNLAARIIEEERKNL